MKYVSTVIFSILLATVYARSHHSIESLGSRIINGKTAPKGAFPYVTSLLYIEVYHICGGAILNDRWILTAAHCLEYITSACVGTNKINIGCVYYNIKDKYPHPDYVGAPDYEYDVALIKLDKSIEFDDNIKTVPLPSSPVKDNQEAVLAGWGIADPESFEGPIDLQYFNVTLLTSKTCEKGIPIELHKSQICAQGRRDQGACHGDSGSPLVADGAVVGIISRAVKLPCASGYPDIYTDVHSFLNWINDVINNN